MKRLPQISEAEYEVMKTVWRYAPITTNEVTDRMLKTTDWSPKTVQTLLKRLVTKGALTYEKKGRMFVYSPVFPEEAYLRQAFSGVIITGICRLCFLPSWKVRKYRKKK